MGDEVEVEHTESADERPFDPDDFIVDAERAQPGAWEEFGPCESRFRQWWRRLRHHQAA